MKSLLKITFLSLFSLCISLVVNAETKTKTVSKTYSACSNLKVDTRYSRVEFKAWDKDKIKFDIEISAESIRLKKLRPCSTISQLI